MPKAKQIIKIGKLFRGRPIRGSRQAHGFTLIELSIVIAIIGLLIGGIVTGRHLIRAAEINKQITLFSTIQTATNTFKLKYDAFPGDMKDATTYFPNAMVANGDGDGHLTNSVYLPGVPFAGEVQQFWIHLAQAKLINLSPQGVSGIGTIGVDFPKNPASNSGMVAVYTPTPLPAEAGYYQQPSFNQLKPGHYLWLNMGWNVDATYPFINNASGRRWANPIVYALDTKLDDGKPGTGTLLAPGVFMQSAAMGGTNGPLWSYNGLCSDYVNNVYLNVTTESFSLSNQGDQFGCYIVYRFAN